MRSILLALVLMPFVAFAGQADLTWTNATTNTDGSSIPATGPGSLTNTIVEYGTCAGTAFGTKQGEITVAMPAASARVSNLVAQVFCFRAKHTNIDGAQSDYSNVVSKAIAAPKPRPPGTLAVANTVAYTVIQRENRFVMLPVGTVPANTPCDATQSVNGYYAVPRSAVQWSGNVQPDAVVAQCS